MKDIVLFQTCALLCGGIMTWVIKLGYAADSLMSGYYFTLAKICGGFTVILSVLVLVMVRELVYDLQVAANNFRERE